MSFCTAGVVDPSPLVGVVGVFTFHDGHRQDLRDALRHSWTVEQSAQQQQQQQQQQLLVRFVARGRGVGALALRNESARNGDDILFVDSEASLPRSVGPLATLLAWWECALVAWPSVHTIGKADDDVLFSPPAVAAHVHATLTLLQEQQRDAFRTLPPPRLYWGVHETFHWDANRQVPVGWSYGWGRHGGSAACEITRAPANNSAVPPYDETNTFERVGPFAFAKGPLFMLSSALIRELFAGGLRGRIETTFDARRLPSQSVDSTSGAMDGGSAMVRGRAHNRTKIPAAPPPWEDAFTGLALALSVKGDGLFAVSIGSLAFSEAWGAYPRQLRRSTLIYHENVR